MLIMSETYRMLAEFAQTWGLIYFVTVFALVLVWVLWPSRKRMYDNASRVPLRED
jgi:cytochrome c oxidase cbb3-type subunit 4